MTTRMITMEPDQMLGPNEQPGEDTPFEEGPGGPTEDDFQIQQFEWEGGLCPPDCDIY